MGLRIDWHIDVVHIPHVKHNQYKSMKKMVTQHSRGKISRMLKGAHLVFFSLVMLLPLWAEAQSNSAVAPDRKVTLNFSNVPLKQALGNLQKVTSYRFLYNTQLVDETQRVSISASNEDISSVLDKLFSPLNISYRIVDRQIVLSNKENNQERNPGQKESKKGSLSKLGEENSPNLIKGKIVDQDGKTLPGVTIMIQGTIIGTTTDAEGHFSIDVPKSTDMLSISYVGFHSKIVKLTAASIAPIKLEPAMQDIDEVVVVAYGTSSKKAMTGAVTSVTSEMIARNKTNNALASLQGMVPGLQLSNKAGDGGSSTQEIIIRGNSSINASNEPLYIIDGVPSGSMNAINPDDIESISVLKDASAISLYGARATNGVILITTKQGSFSEQRSVVTYSGQVGISTRTGKSYKMVDPKGYYELSWEALKNGAVDNPSLLKANGKNYADAAEYASNELIGKFGYNAFNMANPVGLDGKLNPNASLLWWENYDDELLKNGIRHEHNISISGGSKRMKNYVSVGYLNQQGLEPGSSGFERLTTRMNFTYDLSSHIQVGANVGYTNNKSESESINGSGSFSAYSRKTPGLYPLYKRDPQGQIIYDVDGNKMYDFGDGLLGINNSRRPDISEEGKGINPFGMLDLDNSSSKSNNVTMNFFAKIKLFTGLSLHTTYASNYNEGNTKNYINSSIGSGKGIGSLSTSNSTSLRWTFNSILSYEKSFIEGHKFKALVGTEVNESNSTSLYANSSGFLFDGMEEHGVASSWLRPGVPAGSSNSTLQGFFSKVEYEMYNRYFVSGSLRRDGSSSFHPDSRWGNFWSIGGSWILSSEEFLKDVNWLSMAKLRASYGTAGNIGSPNFRSYYMGGYKFLDQPGFNYSSMSNKDLKWEVNKQLNIGLETNYLNNRIRTVLEVYNRITNDLFYNVPISPSTGFGSVLRNIGSLRNRGIEFTLNTENIKSNDFRWTSNFNIATNKNKILALNQDEFVMGNRIYKVGMSTNEFFIPDYAGVNPDNGNPMWYIDEINTTTGEKTGNKVRTESFSELSNKTVTLDNGTKQRYTNLGKYKMGSYSPTVSGGFNNTVNYKGVDFSFLLTYSLGAKVLMEDYFGLMGIRPSVGSKIYQFHEAMLDRWQKPGDITNVPRITSSVGANYYGNVSSNMLRSGDYLKLKNVILGYTIPEKVYGKLNLTSARIYFQADNVCYWSAEQGFDPEQVTNGSVVSQFPAISTYSFGIKLNF